MIYSKALTAIGLLVSTLAVVSAGEFDYGYNVQPRMRRNLQARYAYPEPAYWNDNHHQYAALEARGNANSRGNSPTFARKQLSEMDPALVQFGQTLSNPPPYRPKAAPALPPQLQQTQLQQPMAPPRPPQQAPKYPPQDYLP